MPRLSLPAPVLLFALGYGSALLQLAFLFAIGEGEHLFFFSDGALISLIYWTGFTALAWVCLRLRLSVGVLLLGAIAFFLLIYTLSLLGIAEHLAFTAGFLAGGAAPALFPLILINTRDGLATALVWLLPAFVYLPVYYSCLLFSLSMRLAARLGRP